MSRKQHNTRDESQPLLSGSASVSIQDAPIDSTVNRETDGETHKSQQRQQPRTSYNSSNQFTAPNYWTPGLPNSEKTAEENASFISSITYSWIGDTINRAVAGDLPRGIVMPLSECDRTIRLCEKVHTDFSERRARRHNWDTYVDDPRCAVRLLSDTASRGIIRFIGTREEKPDDLTIAVEWSRLPREYAQENSENNMRSSLLLTRGTFRGETLFVQKNTNSAPRCSLESPDTIRLVALSGGGQSAAAVAREQQTISTRSFNNSNSDYSNNNTDKNAPPPSDGTSLIVVKKPRMPSLLYAVITSIGWPLVWCGALRLLIDGSYLVQPLLLQQFVDFISEDDPNWHTGALIVLGFFALNLLSSVSFQKHFHICMRMGLNFRGALMGEIVHKALSLAPRASAHPGLNPGRVINMLSSDVERLNEVCGFVHYVWSSPLSMIIAISVLYTMIGWIAFASVGFTVITIPLQALVTRMQYRVRMRLNTVTDKRVKATNEFFSGVRIVKFMGWEPRFRAHITDLRRQEISLLKRMQYLRIASVIVTTLAPLLVTASVFVLYHCTGHKLTPRIVFPVIGYLNTLRLPFIVLPWVLNTIVNSFVSIRRISRYLDSEDIEQQQQREDEHEDVGSNSAAPTKKNLLRANEKHSSDDSRKSAVEMSNATFAAYVATEIFPEKKKEAQAKEAKEGKEGCWVAIKNKLARSSDKQKKSKTSLYQIEERALLHNITLSVPENKLTVLIGATGCGKSSLLESLLGYLKHCAGTSSIVSDGSSSTTTGSSASIAFVPQQSWLMAASIKENIVFFDDFQQKKFDEVARVCQLDADFAQLSHGAETEIGERGVTLSGGQKARVCLARAVYAQKQIYLLDDPLSAVDAHVGKSLVDDCICGGGTVSTDSDGGSWSLSGTTRILATHQLWVLPKADHIIVLDGGRVEFEGGFEDYQQKYGRVGDATAATRKEEEKGGEEKEGEEAAKGGDEKAVVVHTIDGTGEGETEGKKKEQQQQHDNAMSTPPLKDNSGTEKEGKQQQPAAASIMTMEERAEGEVQWDTFKTYFMACGGWCTMVLLLVVFTVTECVNAATVVWLAMWSSDSFDLPQNTYLYVYIALVVGMGFTGAIRAAVLFDATRRASLNLHKGMLESVSEATTAFFDTTPLGRIMNRFAKDIDQCDNNLPSSFLTLLQVTFSLLSNSLVMIVSQFFVLVAIVPVAYVYSKILKFFNAANREIKRVDSINKSPVFAIASEIIEGARTISAFRRSRQVLQEAVRRVDAVYSSSYLQQVANRWLGLRLEFLGNCLITTIALAGVATKLLHFATSGSVGIIALGLTVSLQMTQQMNWLVRTRAAVEADMNGVERIAYYTHDIQKEYMGAKGKDDEFASRNAAFSGQPMLAVTFRDVTLSYRSGLPPVLKGVNFTIYPRQKVGIVGRTGSGKSTTLMAFLRIVEISSGEILINGFNTRDLSLPLVRSLFATIPQEPTIFSGTIRSNLDPFDERTDDEVQQAIRKVGLWDRIFATATQTSSKAAAGGRGGNEQDEEAQGLQTETTEGGKNFSVGQRQLLCLARALLKSQASFILMDEATANIDPQLDNMIQETIHTAFRDKTVITIAHRLKTVMHSDVVIVMDDGVVVEMGSPAELLEEEAGVFRGMVEAQKHR